MHSLTELEANDWPGWWSQQINVALHMRGSAYLITGCSMHFQASKHTFTWCWIVFDEFVDVEGTLYWIAYRSLLDCLLQLCIVFASKLARSHFDSSSELSDFNFVMANAMKKALLEGDMPRESSRSPKLGIRIPIMPPRMDPPQPASCSDEDWKGCMQRWRANGELPSWKPTGSKQTFRNQDAGSSATELEPHNENSVAHYPIAEQDGIWECSCGTWNPEDQETEEEKIDTALLQLQKLSKEDETHAPPKPVPPGCKCCFQGAYACEACCAWYPTL